MSNCVELLVRVWKFEYGETDYIAAFSEEQARRLFESMYAGEDFIEGPDAGYEVTLFTNLNRRCFINEDNQTRYSARGAIKEHVLGAHDSIFPFLVATSNY